MHIAFVMVHYVFLEHKAEGMKQIDMEWINLLSMQRENLTQNQYDVISLDSRREISSVSSV